MKRLKDLLVFTVIITLIASMSVTSFAGNEKLVSQNHIELTLTENNIDSNGCFEAKLMPFENWIPTGQGTISGFPGVIESEGGGIKALPSLITTSYIFKKGWSGSTLELGIGCRTNSSKPVLRYWSGKITVANATGAGSTITTRNFSISNPSGSMILANTYDFNLGNRKSCRVKITDEKVTDIYGRTTSPLSLGWKTIYK